MFSAYLATALLAQQAAGDQVSHVSRVKLQRRCLMKRTINCRILKESTWRENAARGRDEVIGIVSIPAPL